MKPVGPYLKEAFFLKTSVPVFGSLPINIIALLGFLMLGFGHPGFWLIGLGLEAAYLYGTATSHRFQRWVDAGATAQSEQSFAEQWRMLIARLDPASRQRLMSLESKCERIIEKYHEAKSDEFFIQSNQDALRQLNWLYLKLLIAKTNLQGLETHSDPAELRKKIEVLNGELKDAAMPSTVRESKNATLDLLHKRLENRERRETSLKEIESDLGRIDEHIGLALENATMEGHPQAISANIDVFSQVLEERFYGESARAVAELDRSLQLKE